MSKSPKEEPLKNVEDKEKQKDESPKDIKNLDLTENNSRNDTLDNLDIGQMLKEQEESDIKYNFQNIEEGKQYFKDRYIQEKMEEISSTIKRMSLQKDTPEVTNKELRNSCPLFINKNSNTNFENYEKEAEIRKCETEFLLIVEKAVISFNLKKYQESYTYLENSGVIKNILEFGKFLLVVSGFDKGILGEFLAKEKAPNENKDVLNSFINTIDLNYKHTIFFKLERPLKQVASPHSNNQNSQN